MSIKSILEIVWSRYGLGAVVVIVAVLVVLDQLYHFGLGGIISGILGQ